MLTWEMGHVVLIRFSTSRAVLLHRNITVWKLQTCSSVRRLYLYCYTALMGTNGALHLLRKCSAPFSFGQCYSWKDSKLGTMFSFNSQTCWKTKEKACFTFHWSQWFLSLFALQITSSPLWQERKSLCLSLHCLLSYMGTELTPSRQGVMHPLCYRAVSAVPSHLNAFLPISW